MPFEFFRWQIAREFGWTLPQVDALSLADLREYFQVRDGIDKHEGKGVKKGVVGG